MTHIESVVGQFLSALDELIGHYCTIFKQMAIETLSDFLLKTTRAYS